MLVFRNMKTLITLWAREYPIFLSRRESFVDVIAESSISSGAQTIICLDVFLDGLTAIITYQHKLSKPMQLFLPGSITFFQLY